MRMRINAIEFPMGYDTSKCYDIPKCVKRGCLKDLLKVVEEAENEKMKNPEDLSKIKLARFNQKYNTED